ncbi:MAG: multicopper oxidase domain-containing protein, partial [Gemmatimonadota bacterium]
RWRVLNAANDIHPMHLHGFYFRVDAFDGPNAAADGQGAPGRMVVTERMSQFSTMSLTWIPERAGNWMFHCHFQRHVAPHGPLGVTGPDGQPQRIGVQTLAGDSSAHANHALSAMAGLAVGIEVRPRNRQADARAPGSRGVRRLRLIAVQDSGFPVTRPSMRFTVEGDRVPRTASVRQGVSPTLDLTRGEPVEITVVNRLRDPLSVHWHGIELESYFDGVAGFSGAGARLSPATAPRDSFVARFTPPRAGTFLYHSHMDETRHHRAGLVGAILVHEASAAGRASAPATSARAAEDVLLLVKSARDGSDNDAFLPATDAPLLEINGKTNPDTTVWRVGQRYRIRLASMQVGFPNATVWLTSRPDSSFNNLRDTLVVQWLPVAKDGADLPRAAQVPRQARQIVSMGETFDFEYTPDRRGDLRIEVRAAGARGRLFVRMPIRVQ